MSEHKIAKAKAATQMVAFARKHRNTRFKALSGESNKYRPSEGCARSQSGGRHPVRMIVGLERFRAKWVPVRVKKTHQNKNLAPGSDSIRTGNAPDRK
jgi:hypothetical protein